MEIKNTDNMKFSQIYDQAKKADGSIDRTLRADGKTLYTSTKAHNIFAGKTKLAARRKKYQGAKQIVLQSLINEVGKEKAEAIFKKLNLTDRKHLHQSHLDGIKKEVDDHKASQRAQQRWGKIKNRLQDIGKLAPKGKLMPVARDYHAEVLRPLHEPILTSGKYEIKGAVDKLFFEGSTAGIMDAIDFDLGDGKMLSARLLEIKDECDGDFVAYKTAANELLKECFEENKFPKGFPEGWLKDRIEALDNRVSYLPPPLRDVNTVKFEGGKWKSGSDNFDTTGFTEGKNVGHAAFVVTADGTLRAAPHQGGNFHHSSFEGGERVLSAGMIKMEDGVITSITNNSGHYKPDAFNILEGIHALAEAAKPDAPFSPDCTVKLFSDEPIPIKEFLEKYEPLREEHWNGIFEERAEYAEKYLK